ncbi:unnamed protein product [Allacma fusca]|uniref:Uncharacterized protein n=1 Tax=Allacma fusca TaxID=39272 RepID=A0A8J2JWX8_9HEXA|nr:unnamed protein product [Allacma fusca]
MKISKDASKDQIMIEVEKVLNLTGIDVYCVEDAKIIPWRANSAVKCRYTSAAIVRSLLKNSPKLKGTEFYIQQELSVDQRKSRNGVKEFLYESNGATIAKAGHEWVYHPTTRKKNIPAPQAGAVRYVDQIRADSNLPRKRNQIRVDIMKLQTLFFGILLVGLVSVEFSHGINIFGRKKKTLTTTTGNILSYFEGIEQFDVLCCAVYFPAMLWRTVLQLGRSVGIQFSATDYYFHHFFLALRQIRRNQSKKLYRDCTSKGTTTEFMFQTSIRFLRKFSVYPFFFMEWFNDPFHAEDPTTLAGYDGHLENFPKLISSEPKLLRKSLIVLIGDHVSRWGHYDGRSMDSYIERATPPLFIRIPDQMAEEFPHIVHTTI